MKNSISKILGFVFVGLLVANIFVFMQGIGLSDEIHTYETGIKAMQEENIQLEKKVFKLDSITYAASLAAELKYGEGKSKPMYLGNTGFALNR